MGADREAKILELLQLVPIQARLVRCLRIAAMKLFTQVRPHALAGVRRHSLQQRRKRLKSASPLVDVAQPKPASARDGNFYGKRRGGQKARFEFLVPVHIFSAHKLRGDEQHRRNAKLSQNWGRHLQVVAIGVVECNQRSAIRQWGAPLQAIHRLFERDRSELAAQPAHLATEFFFGNVKVVDLFLSARAAHAVIEQYR